MKRKNVIICSSIEDMERKSDRLLEQGFHVERDTSVQPIVDRCYAVYRLTFWK